MEKKQKEPSFVTLPNIRETEIEISVEGDYTKIIIISLLDDFG